MPQVIPLNSDGARRVAVDLGGDIGVVTFRSRFNSTVPGWYLDLLTSDGLPLVCGLGLVAPHNIIRHLPRLVKLVGDLRVVDIDGRGNVDPDRLGVGVGLIHYSPGEYDTLFPQVARFGRPLGYDLDSLFSTSSSA